MCDEGSKGINEQASYAATKLRQLYDKLEYKRQALGSIQNAPKPDRKVTVDKQRSQDKTFNLFKGFGWIHQGQTI